jgi:ubiquitin carboxyl-terminal hydrolase 5/13
MDPRNLKPICPVSFTSTDEACPHAWDDGSLAVPTASTVVHKQECGYCFNTNEHHEGVFVCMKCFQGFCGAHVKKHEAVTNHPLYMRVKQTYVKAAAPTSLESIGVEAPPELETSVVCLPCQVQLVEGVGLTAEVVMGIHTAITPQLADQLDVQNAHVHATCCKHCEVGGITQVPEADRKFRPGHSPTVNEKCHDHTNCECATNNWMCLTCGYVGCPRAETGGKQHAMMHFLMSGHPLVVKLGTVTPVGADVHCYACDDEVRPKELAKLLSGVGIDQMSAKKTSKTLSEMMVDQSLQFDYNSITESGSKLEPVYGAHFTGLKNFGNTCYMSTVLQCLDAIPTFHKRFVTGPLADHQAECRAVDPHECHACQLEKLFKGIASGSYSVLRERPQDLERLNGVTPRDFKKLFCKGHVDYATHEQQDAPEFLVWLLTQLSRREQAVAKSAGAAAAAGAVDPGKALDFVLSTRTQCSSCGGCKYDEAVVPTLVVPIPLSPAASADAPRPETTLDECLSRWMMPSSVDCRCDHCKAPGGVTYTSSMRMRTMPDVLAIHVLRQYTEKATGQTKKLDCFVDAPDELDVERLRGGVPEKHETVWEVRRIGAAGGSGGGGSGAAPKTVEVDEMALVMVMSMGIEAEDAKRALQATDNNIERAIDYHFNHQDSPQTAPAAAESAPANETAADSSVPDGPGKYELFALISHIGHSALTGHYVAHIKKEGRWVIFNDEKVAESKEPPKRSASVYFYRRV